MSTTTCPACAGDVSKAADRCPHCGDPLGRRSPVKVLGIVAIVACGIWIVVAGINARDDARKEADRRQAERTCALAGDPANC